MAEQWWLELAETPIFSGLTAGQLEKIRPCIAEEEAHYRTGETVRRKGERLPRPGMVIQGSLSLCNCDHSLGCGSDSCHAVVAAERYDLFGEVAAFSSDCCAPFDIVATTDTRVLYLSPDFFLSPCGKDCAGARAHRIVTGNMLRLLSDRAVSLDRRVKVLSAPDLRTKIALYLCDLCDDAGSLCFELPLNRDGLSDYLAVARPSLSREMIRLREQGVIDFERSRVRIVDPDSLRAISRRA